MPLRRMGEWNVQIHIFLTWALVGGEWSASRPGHFTLGERDSGTNWKGGWVGPRAVLGDVENRKFLTLPGLELRPLGCLARSQSLHQLRHTGSQLFKSLFSKIFVPLHATCSTSYDWQSHEERGSYLFTYLFTCGLFNDDAKSSDYIAISVLFASWFVSLKAVTWSTKSMCK
jgi:hypothetical protein